jgi:hypothetical protein
MGHKEEFSSRHSTIKMSLPISTSIVSLCGGAIITGSIEKPGLSEN